MLTKGAETLKGKDVQTFKSLAKFHDTKNFKKGLKTADKLLQTNPDHPETLALKALFQSNLGEQAKALQTARVALMKSKMKSLLCWHTYGTLLKNKRDYYEAAKSFQNALKMDPQNLQLLRETANLYIQVRDHPNHVQARFALLKLKPNVIHHWSSFALAYHLKQDYVQLAKALNSLNNLVLGSGLKHQQLSQYHLYRILTLNDSGNFQGMYQQLLKFKQKILDEVLWKQDMVKCCQKLGKTDQAIKNMQQLIKYFPQNLQYLTKYSKMVQMSGRQFYKKMNTEFNSKISKIMEISCIDDENQFKDELRKFVKSYYQKNLVSLYTEIQVLYNSEQKEKWIGEIFNEYYVNLKDGKYPDGTPINFPTQYVWALYLLSQHLSRNFETLPQAYERILEAVKHTNTVPQFYIVKGQIQYKMHNNCQAVKTINEARKVDLADRYMNNICIKYLMRCQKPNQAEDVLRLFMRQQSNLYELQNQWFIIEAGKSFLKSRDFAPALRHFNFIQKQFTDMYANHYDFHTYCVRKWTLREYIELIHFNDNLYKDKKYIEAASHYISGLIQYWISLKKKENEKKEQTGQQKEQQDKGGKKKKKNKKKQAVTETAKQESPLQGYRKKLDYYGKQYIEKLTDPLKEAHTIATNVLSAIYVNKGNKKQNSFYFKAYCQCIQILIHFNKPLLVLKALKRLKKTQGGDKYDTHIFEIKALVYLENYLKEGTEELSKEFIKHYLKDMNIDNFHKETVSLWGNSIHAQIKTKQANLFSKKIWSLEESHNERSNLYREELSKLLKAQYNGQRNILREVFYIVHKLEFLGQLSEEMKNQLNSKFGKDTKYFTNWQDEIDKLPLGTWSQWWLSDYDVKRQVLENEQKAQQTKKEQQPDQQVTKEESKQQA